jgi:arylsulfatase A-like enzyme
VEPAPAAARAKPDSPGWSNSGEFYKYAAPFPKTRPLGEEAQRQVRRAYLACVRYVDRQVGKVLDALRAEGLAENTVVVVWGDHGWHLGEQQVWGKHTPFERALRSVLMVRAPGVTRAGFRSAALVEATDLYPTLVDLCDPSFRKTHHPLDGTSLRPLLTGERKAVRESAVSWWRDHVSVRTASHRLVTRRTPSGEEQSELYDLREDEDSMRDISEQEPALVTRLRREAASARPGSTK